MRTSEAPVGTLDEIFSGIQGEGLYVGARQLFVRLVGCNLACRYCDTPRSLSAKPTFRAETSPGSRVFADHPNPVSVTEAARMIDLLDPASHRHQAVALTGGEPLAHGDFALDLARVLHESGRRILLETNGSLPAEMQAIRPWVDIVSMDIKLPSTTQGQDLLAVHEEFLRAASGDGVYVKILVGSETSDDELLEAVKMVEKTGGAPVILQPVTPSGGVTPPSPERVLRLQSLCIPHASEVRVIPQCHRLMGQL